MFASPNLHKSWIRTLKFKMSINVLTFNLQDGNGCISADELRYMLTHLGQKFSEEEVEDILTAADVNGDGQLDYEGWFLAHRNIL